MSLGDRVVDASCVGFAVWTICAHAVVFAGGDLYDLLLSAALVGAAAVVFVRWRRVPSDPAAKAAAASE